jgi:hypothetical protein
MIVNEFFKNFLRNLFFLHFHCSEYTLKLKKICCCINFISVQILLYIDLYIVRGVRRHLSFVYHDIQPYIIYVFSVHYITFIYSMISSISSLIYIRKLILQNFYEFNRDDSGSLMSHEYFFFFSYSFRPPPTLFATSHCI